MLQGHYGVISYNRWLRRLTTTPQMKNQTSQYSSYLIFAVLASNIKNRFHVYLISVYFIQKIDIQEPVYSYIPVSLTESGKSPAGLL